MLSSHQKDTIGWLFGVVLTATCLATGSYFLEGRRMLSRNPASVLATQHAPANALSKKERLLGHSDSHHHGSAQGGIHRHAKGSSSLVVDISGNNVRPEAGQAIELEAKVQVMQEMNSLEFTWLLPDGVTAVSGETQGSIGTLAPGSEMTLRLSVTSSVAENKQIHLHVFRRVNGEAQGHMAQYNTVDQPKLDASIKSKAEILGRLEDGGPQRKLVQ